MASFSTFNRVRRTARIGYATVFVLGSACGPLSQPPQTPDAVVRDFARALGDGQAAAAYALMSPAYRQRVSFEAFHKDFDANPLEVTEAENRLSHVQRSQAVRPFALHADGTRIELVHQDGQWFIASDEIDFYDQSTPHSALRSFVHALTRKRYDVVLRLTPEADKESVTSELMEKRFGYGARDDIERLLSQLRAHLADPVEITGDHATMPYAEHKQVQFVRELGRWRIEAPE